MKDKKGPDIGEGRKGNERGRAFQNSKCEGPEVKLRERRSKTAVRVAGGKGARKRRAGFVVRPDHNEPWRSLALIIRPTGRSL